MDFRLCGIHFRNSANLGGISMADTSWTAPLLIELPIDDGTEGVIVSGDDACADNCLIVS